MYKCHVCGTEFESKFCPNCGAPAPMDACPNCGAKLSPADKFCPECGQPLRPPAGKPQSAANVPAASSAGSERAHASPAAVKFLAFLPHVTAILFALFSVVLFLMFLGPVSTMMGMSTGSIYDQLAVGASEGGSDLIGAIVEEALGGSIVRDVCISLVVFASLGAVLAVCTLAFRLSIPLRVKKIGNLRVCTLLNGCVFLFYLADFLLGCILCGEVSNELTSPGAGSICVMVFALLFGLCSAGAVLVWQYRKGLCPSAATELERQKAERRAGLVMPTPPEEVKKPGRRQPMQYGEEAIAPIRKYEKAKKLFFVMASLGLFLAIFTCVFVMTYPYTHSASILFTYTIDDETYMTDLYTAYTSGGFIGTPAFIWLITTPHLGIGLLLSWLISVVLYFVLGGTLGAVYLKKAKANSKNPPEKILRTKKLCVIGILYPILIFVVNFIIASLFSDFIFGYSEVSVGIMIVNTIITALYIIGELPFLCRLLKRGRKLRFTIYPEEVAYCDYLIQRRTYEIQLAYYEEGIVWKKARS